MQAEAKEQTIAIQKSTFAEDHRPEEMLRGPKGPPSAVKKHRKKFFGAVQVKERKKGDDEHDDGFAITMTTNIEDLEEKVTASSIDLLLRFFLPAAKPLVYN